MNDNLVGNGTMKSDSQWRTGCPRYIISRCFRMIVRFLIVQHILTIKNGVQTADCPSLGTDRICLCHSFEKGLVLECPEATEKTIRTALETIISSEDADTLVQSLNIYGLDKSIEELKNNTFPPGSQIRHLQISQSFLREIKENAFVNLNESLESLFLLSGRLPHVPQNSLASLRKLAVLDLEGNLIKDLPSWCFYGLKLMKLSLKSNEVSNISEYAFAGLEDSLSDLDLSENKLTLFPMLPLRRLESLVSLKLAGNDISELRDDGYSILKALLILDLNNNNFEKLGKDCFKISPTLHKLSLYFNSIETVNKDAFISLEHLESIDLSHNKIVFLDMATFKANQRLRTIELSHNHIHYIGGVFAKLPDLRDLYLGENNILEIPADVFASSANLNVIYLEQNAIRRIDAKALNNLIQLTQLHLSNNYIEKVPLEFFQNCKNLSSLSLDGNKIIELQPGTFSHLNQLQELRLQENRITRIKRGVFSPLSELMELHLQNNAITEMETGALKTLKSLQHVNLQGNQLIELGDVFQLSHSEPSSGVSSLVSIQLDSNGLAVLHNDSLRGQASVRIMYLGHNKLTQLQAPLFRDLLLVERLYLTNNSISKIEDTAFKPMQALRFLELSMNKLNRVTEKTFSELHKLEELYLRDNGLETFDPHALTALRRLRVLDLMNNQLPVLHDAIFQHDLPIEILNLKNCSIKIIENGAFHDLNNLVDLNLEDNKLTAESLLNLRVPGLRTLLASGNNFSHIMRHSLNGLPALQELHLNQAQIHQLPATIFILNRNLAHLHLENNSLETLPFDIFDRLLSLKEIHLDHNRIRDLPYLALAHAKNLQIITISYNEISTVDVANLTNLEYLRELDLSHNRIASMSGFAMANLSRLIVVDLSVNHLTALPANFFAHSSILRQVDLSHNKFHQIPAVALSKQNLPALAWLNFTKNTLNRIHDLPSEAMYPVLETLDISATNLSIVASQDFEAFPSLKQLYLSHNSIIRVSPGAFRSLPYLLTLHLGMNSLEILPKERLQGMENLVRLNLTHNRLKELEEFPKDLKSLEILDLSYNEIGIVGVVTFRNLVSLIELHIYGNRITAISNEAFKPLKKLQLLDLSRNYLENLPLNALRPLETQIRSLRTEENPLHCDCESQELWEWLRDHQKLVGGVSRGRGHWKDGVGIGDVEGGLLRCEQPPELRGLVFLDLDPRAFCSAPLVMKLAIQDIQPFSVLVSWQSRNHSGLYGYQVAYHALDNFEEVQGKLLDPKSRFVKLTKLTADTRYLICVLGLGSWSTPMPEDIGSWRWNTTSVDNSIKGLGSPAMINSPTSKCTEVRTLDLPHLMAAGDGTMNEKSGLTSILTRRLGLIVGSCMGFVVFVVLILVLGYMKMKKQRAAMKREQPLPTNPPEYLSYRHFSLQSGDRTDNTCPSFISNIGTTPLNS